MNVILYTRGCPKCRVLEKKLKAKNVEYQTCDDINVMQEKNISSLPHLDVDGTLYDFSKAIVSFVWTHK